MSDEIELRVGDKVKLEKEYDDGWAFGKNLVTGQTGLFPADCLPGHGEIDKDEKGNKKNKQRASSFYDAGQSMYGAESTYGGDSMYGAGGGGSAYGGAAGSAYGGDSMYVDNSQSKDVGGAIRAVYDFTPSMPDEVFIAIGDKIQVKQRYDDGWAFGLNLTSNKEGLFPQDVLPGAAAPSGGGGNKNRVSSLYGGAGGNNDSMYYGNGTDSMYDTSYKY
ncbi:hypothetical protein BDR26DRAFT_625730 [Obelidium mucronatum]|nr:hypothetical protein BDR26DRAFT_625730 [Obelidium mucronatum]